ncbi:hypothetical protein AX16_008047 [Volvariella volvacea WC 439]|nr:hypothetical protein AX16_008047 [Volvariella volvacea WC 439]
MAKRNIAPQSDDEGLIDASQPSKRQKTGVNAGDEVEVGPRNPRNKGKARQEQIEEEEEEVVDVEVNVEIPREEYNEQAEEQFEHQNREKIQASIESKRRARGGIAECGIIESIEMHQFMCHKYLTFHFGPQINFIIGGKSAVLSAITVALGGKSASTGRGNGLKAFIREGQSAAEVSITLKNQGEDAYRPGDYGKSISITRRFTKDGASTWKIRAKDGRVVSTKREELSAICDHMNIQVDNPMSVLTQDAARQFLSASHPSEKYKFFLRGTQLAQLSEEYDACYDNIQLTGKIINTKKEALPALREDLKLARERFREATKAYEAKQRLDDIKKELAWAHVEDKKKEYEKKSEELAKLSRRLPKIQQSLDQATAELETANNQVAVHEVEFREINDVDHISREKQRAQEQLRANKGKLAQFKADMSQIDTSTKGLNDQIKDLDKKISDEKRRMEAHSQVKHEETRRKIDETRTAAEEAEVKLRELQESKQTANQRCDQIKQEGMGLEQEVVNCDARIKQNEGMLQRCKENEVNSLAPYGNNIHLVLQDIKKCRWHGDIPIGPLGVHVKAKDPQKWGDILRSQLRSLLTAFALTDARDRPQLKSLLERHGNQQIQIIIFEKDLFDFNHGEPPREYLTVLRALEISDPYVTRILINMGTIERQILAETRRRGEDMLKQLRGGQAWTLDGFNVRVYPEGGSHSWPLQIRQARDATSLLLTGRNAKDEIRHWTQEIAKARDEHKRAIENRDRVKAQYMEVKREAERLEQEERKTSDAVRRAKVKIDNLHQELSEELPAGVAGFEAAKVDCESELSSLRTQFEDIARQKAAVDNEQRKLIEELKKYKAQSDEVDQQREVVKAKIDSAVQARLKAQTDRNHYLRKLTEEQHKVNQEEEIVKVVEQEFVNWTEKAAEYCARVANPRPVEELKRLMSASERALKEREKENGYTVEEVAEQVNKAKANLQNASRDLRQMAALHKALKASLIKRLARWQEFRRHIALRCKYEFQYHLSHRGYFGKVLFDHKNETLQLKVQTDDQIATQGARDKDPRSLSGGEKSFSTICLLLSLWEAIGCPLRCLDEFDVFMDAVNRRISMKMMIDTAKSSDKKQYILITPQDMTNIQAGETVRIHRMADPERGQGILNFGTS